MNRETLERRRENYRTIDVCRNGHRLTPGNVRMVKSREGHPTRKCKLCERARDARSRAAKRQRNHPAPAPVERYDNAPLREAFLRSDVSAVEVAERCGWLRTQGGHGNAPPFGDSTKVLRILGIRGTSKVIKGVRYVSNQCTVDEPTALALMRALHLDPFEVGL